MATSFIDPVRQRRRTILIVEDVESVQYLMGKAFRRIGVTEGIQVVENGAEAICYLMGEGKYANRKQYPFPSFIITDLNMPGGDGLSVLEHLRGNPEWAVIPTVVFTASNDNDDIKKVYMLGASSYHVKPANFTLLCKQLKLLHEYWMTCEVPEVDTTGRLLQTDSKGKVGERFPQLSGGTQGRVKAGVDNSEPPT